MFRLFELGASGAPLPPGETALHLFDVIGSRAVGEGTLTGTYARA